MAEQKSGQNTIRIKLVRSSIGYEKNQKETVKALGLTKIGQVVERPDNPAIRGMVNTVKHMVEIVES